MIRDYWFSAIITLFVVDHSNAKEVPPEMVLAGETFFTQKGCCSCHAMQSIPGARGMVGPPLDNYGEQVYIAGILPNTPKNLARWLKNPEKINPETAMPNTGLTNDEAEAISWFLYLK